MLDQITAPPAPRDRVGKCAYEVSNKCRESGTCPFDGMENAAEGSYWSSASSVSLFAMVLRDVRVSIAVYAVSTLLQKSAVLENHRPTMFRREGSRKTVERMR